MFTVLGCGVVLALSVSYSLWSWCRYDRFIDAFEHVSTVIDDIYKVNKALCNSPEREREEERGRGKERRVANYQLCVLRAEVVE